jgi:hypothetical protein
MLKVVADKMIAPSAMSVDAGLMAPSVRPSSLRRYRQELRLYIAPALDKMPLDKLKPSQVSLSLAARGGRGAA